MMSSILAAPAPQVDIEDFFRLDIRVGTVQAARLAGDSRKPVYVMEVYFGPRIGRKQACAQVADANEAADLLGRQVLAVVNFPARQVGGVRSEVLVLGLAEDDGPMILISPTLAIPDGRRLA